MVFLFRRKAPVPCSCEQVVLPGALPCTVCAGTGLWVEPKLIDADSWQDARRYAMIFYQLESSAIESVWRAVNKDPTDVELRWQGSDYGEAGSSGHNCRQLAIRTRQADGTLTDWRLWRPEAP